MHIVIQTLKLEKHKTPQMFAHNHANICGVQDEKMQNL
jgi:hypothetical protein